METYLKSQYQDYDTMWHDKKCINGQPRSNNRNIYSSYSKYLAPGTLDMDRVRSAFSDCIVFRTPMIINRLPNKMYPMFSKDECIGAFSLGLLDYNMLERSHFNFCNKDFGERKLSLMITLKAIWALWKIRKEHRNYVWENNVYDAYPLAFRLPPEDIYYVKKMSNIRPSILESIVFNINMKMTIKSGNKSARMMLWLKLNDMNHPMKNKIPTKQWVEDYFEESHPFRKEL